MYKIAGSRQHCAHQHTKVSLCCPPKEALWNTCIYICHKAAGGVVLVKQVCGV